MFQHRSREFDPRMAAIADHLRGIEKKLGRVGQSAGQRTAARAITAGNQIVDAIVPVLSEIVDRFGRGQRATVAEAASFGNDAVKIGAKIGSDAIEQVATQAKKTPAAALRAKPHPRRRPPPFLRDSCVSGHTVNLRSAHLAPIIRTSEHFHVFSPPPRLSVRMFGSGGKKRAIAPGPGAYKDRDLPTRSHR